MERLLAQLILSNYSLRLSIAYKFFKPAYELIRRLLPIFVVATVGYTVITFTQTGFDINILLINIIWMLLVWIYKSINKIISKGGSYYETH